jgi:hypothetical protein
MLEGYENSAVSTEGAESDQSPELKERAKHVLDFYERTLGTMRKRHRLWRENYEFFLGKQWATARPAYRASEVLNYTFAAIQSALPVLTDNRPRFSFTPVDPNDQELALYFEKIAESVWNREGWNLVVADMFLTGMIYGTAFGSMKFDPDGNSGLGRIRFLSVDPFQLYFDEGSIDINDGSCAQVQQVVPMKVGAVKAMFPELADQIKPDLTSSIPSKYSLEGTDTLETSRVINFPTNRAETTEVYTTRTMQDNRVLVHEHWEDDDTMEEVEIDSCDAQGKPLYGIDGAIKKVKALEKKFPDGRRTIVVNGLVAMDDNHPYADGKYPYARYLDYILPQEFYGMGDIDQLKSPQRMINRAVCSYLDNLTQMGNPIWVVDQGAVDTDNLTNAPGLIVETVPGLNVRREPGMPLAPGSTQIYEIGASAFDRIFGSNEVSQGVRTPGITSGVAIDSLQEAAQTRLRLKSRNMEVTLNSIGQMFLSRIMQYWTQPQFVSITSEGMPPEVFQFQIEKEGEASGWYKAKVKTYAENNGKMEPTAEQKEFRTKGLFDVKVTIGSNLPFAKKEKADRAIQLFQLGVVDMEEVLKAVEWPGMESVLRRMQEQAQMQAQAQAEPAAK